MRRRDQSGFTLLDVLVALGLSGLLLGIAATAMERAVGRWRVRTEANEIAFTLVKTKRSRLKLVFADLAVW